jgi:cobaltochelatase CobT
MEPRDWLGLTLGLLAVLYLLYSLLFGTSGNRQKRQQRLAKQDPAAGYRAYQTAYDEEVSASGLATDGELRRRRQLLDARLGASFAGAGEQIARKLDQCVPASGRTETVAVLLLDNSGSMRRSPGAPVLSPVPFAGDCEASSAIALTACAADLLVAALEACGIKVEVLGFTTVAWKGGRSRLDWISDGRPPNPGRLNDLRHIVYKAADATGVDARQGLGVMLDASLLKENVDGEALAWAHSRLLARPETRRVLLVISDGAPVDDSTLSVNPGNFLDLHLRHVIHEIETRSSVELIAIGIGHDVSRYYQNAVTITDPVGLAGALTDQLCKALARDFQLELPLDMPDAKPQ